jgi:polyhydroxybutyrate depolymerase
MSTRLTHHATLALCLLFLINCNLVADDSKPAARASDGSGGKVGNFPNEKIDINGKERAYRLVVPQKLDATKPAPLLLAFHGLGDSKDIMSFYSQLDKLATKQGYVLAYLNGKDRHWPLVVDRAKNDLAFFDGLLAQLSKSYNLDLNRVYLVGFSNGAYFSHLIASQRSDQVAAIAAHSGGMGLLLADPKLKQKYAVLLIHGDADVIVKVKESRRGFELYKKWGHDVEYVEVPKLNHFWAHGVKINDQIAAFFAKHALK